MLRSRVRRSFTVEVKSKSRQTSSWSENPAPSPVNWAALDPVPEPAPPSAPTRSTKLAAPAAPVAAEPPRRILPSLLVAEPEPEAPEPAIAREPRLPRVRRIRPARTASQVAGSKVAGSRVSGSEDAGADSPRSEAIWSFADIDHAQEEIVLPQARPQPVFVPTALPARKPPKAWSATPVLAPGERWKRRLPRACR